MSGEHYVVDEVMLKIRRDTIDFNNPLIFCKNGLVPIELSHDTTSCVVYRGLKTNLNPKVKTYKAINCFTTKEAAEKRLLEVCENELKTNLNVIKNLQSENNKLAGIISGLKNE